MQNRLLALDLSYHGGAYAGWQIQRDQRTVQGEVQRALGEVFGRKVMVKGSGRTDAGVHARSQMAAFTLKPHDRVSPEQIRPSLNHFLPRDIRVSRVLQAEMGFCPTRNAKGKAYRYFVLDDPTFVPTLGGVSWAHRQPWLTTELKGTCDLFLGSHDFAAFRNGPPQTETSVRRIDRFALTPWTHVGENIGWVFEVEGSGFLRQMVRNMVGAVTDRAQGKLSQSDLSTLLAAKTHGTDGKSIKPTTAPAQGLFLWEAHYPRGSLRSL